MARPLRIEFPGALYHLTARGNAGEDIFLDDGDRPALLDVLASVCERFGWRCHAWCQMTNHYHLVVETPEPNLARGMRQLNGVYTQRFNRAHDRTGHVFQGRYKAILVEREAHLLELCRYVMLNPVRAGLVRKAERWRWSSYHATVGDAPAPDWLETAWLLGRFGRSRGRARARFAAFVGEEGGERGIWDDLKRQAYLGSDTFVEEMLGPIGEDRDLSEVPARQHRPEPHAVVWYDRTYPDRHDAMARAYLSGGHGQSAVARHFGVHYSTVSRAVRRHETGE